MEIIGRFRDGTGKDMGNFHDVDALEPNRRSSPFSPRDLPQVSFIP